MMFRTVNPLFSLNFREKSLHIKREFLLGDTNRHSLHRKSRSHLEHQPAVASALQNYFSLVPRRNNVTRAKRSVGRSFGERQPPFLFLDLTSGRYCANLRNHKRIWWSRNYFHRSRAFSKSKPISFAPNASSPM